MVVFTHFFHFSTWFMYSVHLVFFAKWWSQCSWWSQETAEEKVPSTGKTLKITSPLEEAVVDTGTFQVPSFTDVVKVGSSLNW